MKKTIQVAAIGGKVKIITISLQSFNIYASFNNFMHKYALIYQYKPNEYYVS
jgi:hypothetical protein